MKRRKSTFDGLVPWRNRAPGCTILSCLVEDKERERCANAARLLVYVALLLGGLASACFVQVWTEQGPRSIQNATDIPPHGPAIGAVNAIAIDPTDPNTMYAAAVNGGIWKTTNGLAVEPTWTSTTDFQLPALAIQCLAISPANPKVIYAGPGSTSNSYLSPAQNSPGIGLVKIG
jgi:hypothetical protein